MGKEGTLDAVASGEELNTGEVTEPRQAATVIVLRGGAERLEVLLVRRNPEARFMGGAWVFPGGAVDGDEDHRVAGVREVAEEAGVELPDPAALLLFSRWITPPQVRIRFDTLFFLVAAPDGAEPRPDGGETVDVRLVRAAGGARRRDRARLPDDQDAGGAGGLRHRPTSCSSGRDGREVEPIEPMVVIEGEVARVVLPGEPGYRA